MVGTCVSCSANSTICLCSNTALNALGLQLTGFFRLSRSYQQVSCKIFTVSNYITNCTSHQKSEGKTKLISNINNPLPTN
jgi:hypothetical protein